MSVRCYIDENADLMNAELELLRSRHSVRSYSDESLNEAVINKLRSEVTYINTHEAGLNFQLCFDDSSPFAGMARSYGMFRNVRNYMVAVIDPTFPHAYERAGFFAEQFVMEAVGAGLGTCFVGGTFSREHVGARVEVYEKIPFVVAFGIADTGRTSLLAKAAARIAHRKSRSPREFFDGNDAEFEEAKRTFPWLERGLEAVACAPSALNRQPVRLKITEVGEEKLVTAHTLEPEKYAVDLGIAKYNLAAVVPGIWDWGEGGAFYPD